MALTAALTKLPGLTLEFTITIPWKQVSETYEKVMEEVVKNAEIDGFRKGKAPRSMVEKSVDKTKVYEEVIKDILPSVYQEAITQHKIKPVIVPKVELTKAEEGKDWVIRALTCERPKVELKDYKKAITDAKATKHQKIWTPQDAGKKEDVKPEEKTTIDDILKAVFSALSLEIPELLVENEVNRLLSELIDQTKKLGLNVEQYLAATRRTVDSVRDEYKEQAKRTIGLEFALEDIADKEGVLVSDDEIETVIKSAKTEEERKSLEKERYYLASILRRQKTLDYLASV